MKVQSMTGFGKAEKTTHEFHARVEIKSVNNRYIDAQFKLPRSLIGLEPKLRNLLDEFISRGSIICFVQYENLDGSASQVRLDRQLLEKYTGIIRQLQKKFSGEQKIEISELLNIPDLIKVIPVETGSDLLSSQIIPVFKKACTALVTMRITEGKRIISDITGRVKTFKNWLRKVKKYLPERQKTYLKKTRASVQELIGEKVNLDEGRLMTELGIMAERLDITEELVRFESHIALFLETVRTHKTPGKKLGFILQEMLREINTLTSKSQCLEIQHLCVSMKEELEIVREQIQNIE
ncbi:YicC/YloC family endoribonuclease [Fibrobacterota bacterium]